MSDQITFSETDVILMRMYINDLDGLKTCNGYKMLMQLLKQISQTSAHSEIVMCKDCKQFRDHRCMKADHHVSRWGNCMDVFGAERREE